MTSITEFVQLVVNVSNYLSVIIVILLLYFLAFLIPIIVIKSVERIRYFLERKQFVNDLFTALNLDFISKLEDVEIIFLGALFLNQIYPIIHLY